MKLQKSICYLLMALAMTVSTSSWAQNNNDARTTIYDFTVEDMDMHKVPLSDYKGKVLLVINSASHSDFSAQYTDLQKLYKEYRDQGFEILDFPCNQFAMQAPEDDKDYHSLCVKKYDIQFQQFHKIDVNGENAIPLFTWLKSQKMFQGFNPTHKRSIGLDKMMREVDPQYSESSDIKWNFTKFLIDRDGNVIKRFEPTDSHDVLLRAVKECLEKDNFPLPF